MSAIPVHLLDEIDWNEIWKAQQQRHEFSKHFNDPTHNWSQRENAERYDSSSHTLYDARVKTTIAGLLLTKKMTVLDIGAGPVHLRFRFHRL